VVNVETKERERERGRETDQASAVTIKDKFFGEHIRFAELFNGRGSYAPRRRCRRRRRRRRRRSRRRRRALN